MPNTITVQEINRKFEDASESEMEFVANTLAKMSKETKETNELLDWLTAGYEEESYSDLIDI